MKVINSTAVKSATRDMGIHIVLKEGQVDQLVLPGEITIQLATPLRVLGVILDQIGSTEASVNDRLGKALRHRFARANPFRLVAGAEVLSCV